MKITKPMKVFCVLGLMAWPLYLVAYFFRELNPPKLILEGFLLLLTFCVLCSSIAFVLLVNSWIKKPGDSYGIQ